MAVGVASSCAPTPSAQTWGGLKSKVAKSIGFGGDDNVLGMAGESVNNAIRYLSSRMWSWLLTSQDIALVADEADYALPSDFGSSRNTELLNSSGKPVWRLLWEDPKNFGNRWVDRSKSDEPTVYTVFQFYNDCNLSLNHPPTAAYLTKHPTLRLRYYKHLQTFSSDASARIIPPEAELFIEMYARWELSATFRPELSGVWERMWRSQEIALLRAESHRHVKDFT